MRNFKKFLALLLATLMVLGSMVTVSAAVEDETAEAVETVDYDAIYYASAEDLAALGILKGVGDVAGNIDYQLEEPVYRWHMALFIARMLTGETSDTYWSKVTDNTTPYDDVTNYLGAINWADQNDIIKGKGWIPGVGTNCFDPNGPILLQDALTMAVRALGEKQLAYPGGFMEVAKQLGLTEGLEELDANSELTRGQMVQILYNMLYCEINGTSFAQKNFGLEEKVYVLVATNTQKMTGTERTLKANYVALAALNADGTYNMQDQLHFAETELGLEKGEAELKVGFSYTVASYDNFYSVYSVEENATEVYQNYGDNGIAIKSVTAYNNVLSGQHVSINGKQYQLVSSYSDLNNKNTYVGRTPELIVHSLYKGAKVNAFQYYVYDAAFNILDENGDIALMYNHWTNSYFRVLGTNADGDYMYRPATDEDFEEFAVNLYANNVTDVYGVVTSAGDLTTIQFSQITMIDDNNDGAYDRAIYVPYSVGKYTTNINSKTMWKISNSYTSTNQSAASPLINGKDLWFYATNTSGKWISVGHDVKDSNDNYQFDYDTNCYVRESDIIFKGEGKPAKDQYVVYYYNPHSRIFYVVENLGKPVKGTVQTMTQGTYTYDTTIDRYYYKDATVTIDGETYKLGYRPYQTGSCNVKYGYTDLTTDTSYMSDLANYGWSENLYGALLGQAYNQMNYLVLAGRLIYAGTYSNGSNWIAFDYGTEIAGSTTAYTSRAYEGDIIGVDADGNILVSAYVDTTGEPVIAKIGTINGFNYGLLVEDYAALQYQFSSIGILADANAYDTMKKIVIASFFENLTGDLEASTGFADQRQYVFVVAGVSDDGVYNIYTDLDLYWAPNHNPYYQPSTKKANNDYSFWGGITTTKIWTNESTSTAYALSMDNESVILVAGMDGLKVATGIPNDGASIHYSVTRADGSKGTAVAYSVSNDLIFMASKNMTCAEIYSNANWDADNTAAGWTYYMVMGRNSENNYDAETIAYTTFENGAYVYNYKGLYNIGTGETEDWLKFSQPLPSYNTVFGSYGMNQPKPIGAIYAVKGTEVHMLTDATKLANATVGNFANHKFATDSAKVLADLLYYGASVDGITFNPVFDNIDKLVTKKMPNSKYNTGANDNSLFLATGELYDQAVNFSYDVITYSISGNATSGYTSVDVRLTKNNISPAHNDTSAYNNAVIFFDYEEGYSFQGLAVRGTGDGQAIIDALNNNAAQAVLKAQLAAAIADAEAAMKAVLVTGNAAVEAIYNAGIAKLAPYATKLANDETIAASDITAVNTIATETVAAINAELGNQSTDATALAQAKADAKAQFALIFADALGTTAAKDVTCDHKTYKTAEEHLAAFVAEIDACKTVEAVAAYVAKYATETSNYWTEGNLKQHIAAKKTETAAAATLATAKAAFEAAKADFLTKYAALETVTTSYTWALHGFTSNPATQYAEVKALTAENKTAAELDTMTANIKFWAGFCDAYLAYKAEQDAAAEAAKPVYGYDAEKGVIYAKNYFGSTQITGLLLTKMNASGVYEGVLQVSAFDATGVATVSAYTVTKTWDAATQTSTFAFTRTDAMNNVYSILEAGATYGIIVKGTVGGVATEVPLADIVIG